MSDKDSAKTAAADATNAWNAKIIEEFHANEGKVGGPFEGFTLLLLHTKGARTKANRINPVAYLNDNYKIYVFASKAGSDTDPDWYRNLVAEPNVTVEIGSETFAATANTLSGDERERVYAIQAARLPSFAGYQAKTTRVIPVVELVRS
jgi:deazaflavin-dependent oxidoreductase (nitroreductase family)